MRSTADGSASSGKTKVYMKHFILFLCVAGSLSCSQSRVDDEPFPRYHSSEEEWITYEGTLPCQDGADAHVELSLRPGPPGMKSHYTMDETISGKYAGKYFVMGTRSQGTYSVLESANDHGDHIQDQEKWI